MKALRLLPCLALVFTVACDETRSEPTAPIPPPAAIQSWWTGEAAVLSSAASGECRVDTSALDRSGVPWLVVRTGSWIELSVDPDNDPIRYVTRLDGQRFVATHHLNGPPGSAAACVLRDTRIEGEISPDGLSLEAYETLSFGPAETAFRVQVRWRVVFTDSAAP